MKRAMRIISALLVLGLIAALVLSAQGKGILPSMVYRRGLTNEQIDKILAAHPSATLRITAGDWRAMQYQLSRFENMTNYVERIGNSNDCSRVLLQLHDSLEDAVGRLKVLADLRDRLTRQLTIAQENAETFATAYENATNNLAAAMADYMSASNRAARAEARRTAIVDWCETQKSKALLPTTKAIWQSFIDKLNGDDD